MTSYVPAFLIQSFWHSGFRIYLLPLLASLDWAAGTAERRERNGSGSINATNVIRLSRRFRSAHAFAVESDRSKQQTRRFPAVSIEQAFLIRRARVSGCLGGGDPVDPISARIGRDVRP